LQGVRPDGTSRLSQNFLTSALSGSGGFQPLIATAGNGEVAPKADIATTAD
jgi:hypothetical protein